MAGFQAFFAALPDPRAANARHRLDEILMVALIATLCGAQTCVDIAAFARAKLPLLRRFLCLAHGAPSHDTFSRVFQALDPDASKTLSIASWPPSLKLRTARAPPSRAAPPHRSRRQIRASGGRGRPSHHAAPPRHRLGHEQRLVLAQRHARNRSEVSAARAILALLDLRGTASRLTLCREPRHRRSHSEGAGDYALILKGNRGPLHDAARDRLANLDPEEAACTIETEHGRYEERCAWVCEVPAGPRSTAFPGCVPLRASMVCAAARMRPTRRRAVRSATWRSLVFSPR